MDIMPFRDCPKFQWCSRNKCPLDPDYDKRMTPPEDPPCTLKKLDRMELGKNLKNLGLFPRELAGLRTWEGRDRESREKSIEQGLKNLHLRKKK